MVTPITPRINNPALSHLTDQFRQRHAGDIRNDGDVRDIGGFAVDVAGSNSRSEAKTATAIQPGAGVRTFKPQPVSALLSPASLPVALRTQDIAFSRETMDAVKGRSVEGTPLEGMAIAESAEVTHTETVAPEAIQGLGYGPANLGRAEEKSLIESQIARLGELAGAERRLRAEYGEDVKLARDPVADEYLMLRPGQEGYDDVRSAQEVFNGAVTHDIGAMGYSLADFRQVLAKYGVTA